METFEGDNTAIIDTQGLGERINKALANKIDQLKLLNQELDLANAKLLESENNLKNTILDLNKKNNDLLSINKSLGIEDGGIEEQLLAIKSKNEQLSNLNKELENTNIQLSLRDEELQNQIAQYQKLTNDLL